MKSKKQKLSKNICNLSDRKLDKFLNLQSILQSQYERIGPNFQKKKRIKDKNKQFKKGGIPIAQNCFDR